MWQIILVVASQFGIACSRIIRVDDCHPGEQDVRTTDALRASTMRLPSGIFFPTSGPIIILFTTRLAAVEAIPLKKNKESSPNYLKGGVRFKTISNKLI